MDLATLITKRMRQTRATYRSAEEAAKKAGHPISRTMINLYANGKIQKQPDEATIRGLTAALGLPYEEVAAAVHESFGVVAGDTLRVGRDVQRANAWLRLVDDQSDAQVQHLLSVVESFIRLDQERPKSNNASGNTIETDENDDEHADRPSTPDERL